MDVEVTERYFQLDDGSVFDLVGFGDPDRTELQYVVEAERLNEDVNRKRADVFNDYEKLSQVDADVIWVVRKKSDIETLVGGDAEAEHKTGVFVRKCGVDPINNINRKSVGDIRDELKQQDDEGISDVWVAYNLQKGPE
jgi:hypothetical protein